MTIFHVVAWWSGLVFNSIHKALNLFQMPYDTQWTSFISWNVKMLACATEPIKVKEDIPISCYYNILDRVSM